MRFSVPICLQGFDGPTHETTAWFYPYGLAKLVCIACSLLLGGVASSEQPWAAPDSVWSQTFGGTANESCQSICQTSDGGFIAAGYTVPPSSGNFDLYLVRTDPDGGLLWEKTYGGSALDIGYSVAQTADSGFVVSGMTESFGDRKAWLVMVDKDGDLQWQQTYGGTGVFSVVCMNDGYLMAGYGYNTSSSSYDFWLARTDLDGNELWSQMYGGGNGEEAWSVQPTTGGGYVLAGYTQSYGAGGRDFWIVRTDQSGSVLWSKVYGGSQDDWAWSIVETSDLGYAVAGHTTSFGAGGYDAWLLKLNSSGDLEWSKSYGGAGQDVAYCVRRSYGGGYAISGYTDTIGSGAYDFWLVRTAAEGTLSWQTSFGGGSIDMCREVRQTADGGFILGGQTGSFGEGGSDMWLILLAPELGLPEQPSPSSGDVFVSNPEPNPFSWSTEFEYCLDTPSQAEIGVYDLSGRRVVTLIDEPGTTGMHSLSWDGCADHGEACPPGVYLIRLECGGSTATCRVVLLR
jgi:hypothetical protein